MKILEFFKKRKKSSNIAKERLKIIISHQKSESNDQPEYIVLMKEEIMNAIKKYINVKNNGIKIELNRKKNFSTLELSVSIPKAEKIKSNKIKKKH